MERLSHTVKAVIFDMDGTLFDTERISSEAWVEAGCALGDPMPMSLIDSFRGKNDEGISQAMRTHFTREEQIEKAWDVRYRHAMDLIDQNGVPVKAGLHECLQALKDMGIRKCVATSSSRERALKLCSMAAVDKEMEFILCGNEVTRGRPAPDMYQIACKKLSLPPAQCLVVEDSFNGVRSAFAAGCPVVMIPDMDPPDSEIRSMCHAVLESLHELPGLLG